MDDLTRQKTEVAALAMDVCARIAEEWAAKFAGMSGTNPDYNRVRARAGSAIAGEIRNARAEFLDGIVRQAECDRVSDCFRGSCGGGH